MPPGGDLIIDTKEITEEDNRWWESRVKDSGPGIPEDNLSKLFDPFFITKPAGEGTGPSLSVAFGIIEIHGGKIWAQSAPGEGSTFVIRLPLEESP